MPDRPGLTQGLAFVREGDVTWKLDRVARSLPHLIETVNQLEKRGAGLQSLTKAIDTTTPGGVSSSPCSAFWLSSSATSFANTPTPAFPPPHRAACAADENPW